MELLDNVAEEAGEHTHAPSQPKCDATKLKVNIKRTTTESLNPSRRIIAVDTENISETVAVSLSSTKSIRRNIRLHPNPLNRWREFLRLDSGNGDNNRIMMFCSD